MKSRKSTSAPVQQTAARTPEAPTHEAITLRARAIWESRGQPDGQDEEIWLMAERELAGGLLSGRTDEDRFADRTTPFDAEGEAMSEVDHELDRAAGVPEGRSPTSL